MRRITNKQGQAMFEYNPNTGFVCEARWKYGSILMSASAENVEERMTFLLDEVPGCRYLYALNLKNAKRKFGV